MFSNNCKLRREHIRGLSHEMFSDHITVDSINIIVIRLNEQIYETRHFDINTFIFYSLLFLQHHQPKKFNRFWLFITSKNVPFNFFISGLENKKPELKCFSLNCVNACLITQSDDVFFTHNLSQWRIINVVKVKHLLWFVFQKENLLSSSSGYFWVCVWLWLQSSFCQETEGKYSNSLKTFGSPKKIQDRHQDDTSLVN